MKRYLPFIIIAAAACAALGGGALLYRAKVSELTPVATNAGASSLNEAAGDKAAHVRGNPKASVTLEEFGDFQCPPCGTLALVLERIEHDYGDKLRVVFRNFPLQIHKFASYAAGAAEAAGKQGRFWEMHDMLYQKQVIWTKAADVAPLFTDYADSLKLDVSRFRDDIDSPQVRALIRADQQRGSSRGVTSTPTIFINNQPLPPTSLNEKALRAAIDAALRGEALPTPAPTATPAATVAAPANPNP